MKYLSILLCLTLLACNQPGTTSVKKQQTDTNAVDTIIETQIEKKIEPGFKMHKLYTKTLEDGTVIQTFEAVDSTLKITRGVYERREYFKVIQKTESGEKVIQPMTNFLDNLCNSYSAVSIISNDFKGHKKCNSEIPRIVVSKESEDNYYLSYFTDSLVFSKKILCSWFLFNQEVREHDIKEYNGQYIHIWLRDTATGKADQEFVAIGSSGVLGVYEFFIPYEKQRLPHYFTKTWKLETGRIKTVKDSCL